jgi:hypothetical protein
VVSKVCSTFGVPGVTSSAGRVKSPLMKTVVLRGLGSSFITIVVVPWLSSVSSSLWRSLRMRSGSLGFTMLVKSVTLSASVRLFTGLSAAFLMPGMSFLRKSGDISFSHSVISL